MATKSALYALAVLVLTGSMAVAALAGDHGMSMYGPPDSALSADPESSAGPLYSTEIREPVETGAVPGKSVGSSEFGSGTVGDEPTVEIGVNSYRPGVDLGS